MAKSDDNSMKRLDRVEGAITQISTILVEQSERIDSGFNRVHAEIHAVRGEIHGVRGEVHGVRGEVQATREALTDRLDRLIAVTIQERTLGFERLAEIELRLARLEERSGF